jgi:hypothetical protein
VAQGGGREDTVGDGRRDFGDRGFTPAGGKDKEMSSVQRSCNCKFTINPIPSHGVECKTYSKTMFLWEDPMVSGKREDFPRLSSMDIHGHMIVFTSFSESPPETLSFGT